MPRATVVILKALIALALLVLALFQVAVVPQFAFDAARAFPGIAFLVTPGIVGMALVLVCAQVVLVCVWRLVTLAAADRIFDARAFVWVDVIIAAIWTAVGLVVVGTIYLNALSAAPPALFFGTPILVVFGAGAALVVGVMRALLKKAVALRGELDEVV